MYISIYLTHSVYTDRHSHSSNGRRANCQPLQAAPSTSRRHAKSRSRDWAWTRLISTTTIGTRHAISLYLSIRTYIQILTYQQRGCECAHRGNSRCYGRTGQVRALPRAHPITNTTANPSTTEKAKSNTSRSHPAAPTRSAVPTLCTQSTPCRSNTLRSASRSRRPKSVSSKHAASSESRSLHTVL